VRCFSGSALVKAKGDASAIDSFQLPSQTSINEWEFRYDYIPKVVQPKVPPVSQEAIKQDVAREKAKRIELETFAKEANESIKVEASTATVVVGGEVVMDEPETVPDVKGSVHITSNFADPSIITNTAPKKKYSGSDKYVQSSLNPDVNSAEVVNLGETTVDHKVGVVAKQTRVEDDIDADNLQEMQNIYKRGEKMDNDNKPSGYAVPLALLGLGGASIYAYKNS
jgi:hypothetical protein